MAASAPGMRITRLDLLAAASFLALGLVVTGGLWLNPGSGVAANVPDQAFFEWVIAHGAQVVTHGANPFFSDRMGYPAGVNLMANTSILAISLPLTPVTLLWGPRVAFDLALLLGLTLTAVSWYLVLSRKLLPGARLAAWVGALVCAFGPALVSHANAHVNVVSQALIPLVVWRTLALGQSTRWRRNGLLLAVVVVAQVFVNAELLLMVAIALGLFVLVLAFDPEHRARWRSFVAGLLLAAGVAAVVLAYPLYVLFAGTGAYHRVPEGYRYTGAPPEAFIGYSQYSLFGHEEVAKTLAQNPTEQNSFFGLPLLVLCLVLLIGLTALRRTRLAAVGLGLVVVASAAFSLGPNLVAGHCKVANGPVCSLDVATPWLYLGRLPVLESIVPSRWGLVTTVVLGLVLALAVAELARAPRPARWLAMVAFPVALVPLTPIPLPTTPLTNVPAFLTDGAYRPYIEGGRSLMFVPLASNLSPDPVRWAAESGEHFRLTQGYFLGPDTDPDASAIPTAPFRFLSAHLYNVAPAGPLGDPVPDPVSGRVTAADVRRAYADLRYWNVGAVVLQPLASDAERDAVTQILGGLSPVTVDGVRLWDVRSGHPPVHG